MAGCRCGWLLTYTAALSKDSRHHAASTSTGFASDFRRTHRHPNQPRNFSALRRYVGRIRFFIHSRSQPNNYYSSCRFRTAHRKDHFRRLTLRAAARQEVTPMVQTVGLKPTAGNQRRERCVLYRLSYVCIEGECSSFRAASQSCDGAQALLRQQSFKRSRTHLLEGELKCLAFGHVSMCPQLQHRGLRGLLQDFASPIRLSR